MSKLMANHGEEASDGGASGEAARGAGGEGGAIALLASSKSDVDTCMEVELRMPHARCANAQFWQQREEGEGKARSRAAHGCGA